MTTSPPPASLLAEALSLVSHNDLPGAVGLLEQYVQLNPDHSRGHNELGVLYYRQGKTRQALHCFSRAVDLDGKSARALTNLGACYNDLGDNPRAIAAYERALEIDPGQADAWGNLGNLYNEEREHQYSAYCFHRALKIKIKAPYLRGLASAYRIAGRYDRAETIFQQALELEPENAFSHTALAALYFGREEYACALEEYEWRWKTSRMQAHMQRYSALFTKPAYAGEDLTDKTLLVHTEQGYGDNLLFSRYLPLLRPRVGKLVLWCWESLAPLFAHNFEFDFITSDMGSLPDVDYQLPLLSIPYHFDRSLELMSSFRPYLSAPSGEADFISTSGHRLAVGLVWSCDHTGFDYQYKKVPLTALEPLVSNPGIQLYSLQLGPDRRELLGSPLKDRIIDLGPRLTDFLETGKAIRELDLVISVDTATAHLAAAMGKPTWVLTKANPDWRWHGYNGQPLWYPEARLFPQVSLGDWRPVIKHLTRDLKQLLQTQRQ